MTTGVAVNDGAIGTIDGRRARRDRNTESVLQAAVGLLAEGHSHPPGQLIADTANVSLRTVFRCYPTLDTLMKAAILEYIRTRPDCFDWTPPRPGATFAERVDHVVAAQTRLCMVAGKALRAGLDRAVQDPELMEIARSQRRYVLGILQDVFRPELDRLAPREQAIALSRAHNAIFLASWENSLDQHGLTPDEASEAMRRSLVAAFG
jgi:AcrR family transcriptional regulator